MPDLGIDVLFKGTNMLRLLGGLWVAARISLISIVISMPLGILVGAFMTMKNKIVRAICRIYLEIIRIMPQLVLLFIVYFGTTRAMGWNLSGEAASVIVFTLWGTAEMADLVRGALISIPKHQYESAEALGLTKVQTYIYIIIPQTVRRLIPLSINLITRMIKTADHRGESNDEPECCVWRIFSCIFIIFPRVLADQHAGKISGKEMEINHGRYTFKGRKSGKRI